jgi:GTP:adenosylcobinamide-phosphate guanylyltransferase
LPGASDASGGREGFTALVLAGRRAADDASGRFAGSAHRALLEVRGVPMLLRVVRTLRACPNVEAVRVSIDAPAALAAVPELAQLVASGAIRLHQSLPSPSGSVEDALRELPERARVLVTTADHPLLAPAIVEHFLAGTGEGAGAPAGEADVLVGLVRAEVVRARYPESIRTWLRLRGAAYSGANLFAFLTPAARRAAAFWVRAEQFRKRPWRLASTFGPAALLLYAVGRLDLDAALARVSRAMGARVRAVLLPFAEAAIDVDRPADLALAERILGDAALRARPGAG